MADRRAQRVLVLSYFYRPEPNFITADVAESLAEEARVTVVTTQPSYPIGRVYEGYSSRRPDRRVENGVTVWRVPHVLDRSKSVLRRALSYGSYTAAAAILAPLMGEVDVVWVYQTPFTTALAALPVKLFSAARVVYTSADLWPESFVATGVMRPGRAVNAAYAYSKWILRFADDVICSTQGTVERYAGDGYPRERLHYIPVWTEGVSAAPVSGTNAGGPPTIVYAGNLGPAQALDSVVKAAAQLQREGLAVIFALYGTGSEESALRKLAADLGASNVEFRGRVDAATAFAVSSAAAGQIVSLRRSALFQMTVPSKLFTAMAAGAPILAGLHGESLQVAQASGGAIAYESESPDSLARAVRSLLTMTQEQRNRMTQVLRDHYRAHYDRGALLARYHEILFGRGRAARAS